MTEKSKSKKQIYACDFETSIENQKTWVWSYGISKLYQNKIDIGTSIESFMKWALSGNSKTLYFHNSKFDGKFIIYYLLSNGYVQVKEKIKNLNEFTALIDDMGNFYSIKIPYKYKEKTQYATILDSFKLFPKSLAQLAKDYHLDTVKGELDYTKVRYPNSELTQEEKEYLEKDVIILRKLLEIAQENNMKKMTIASNAISFYKSKLQELTIDFEKLFPPLDEKEFDFIQDAYKGGCSMVNKRYRNKIVPTNSYDINSMYPFQLRTKKMPYGYPKYFIGKYKQDDDFPLYVQKLRCEFYLKKNHIPTIQIKNTWGFLSNEWVENSNEIVELTLTNIDLELFLESYDVYNLQYIEGYKFRCVQGAFDAYIDYWYNIKSTTTNPALKEIAKLFLNSLYGKFGTKPKKKSVVLGLKENKIYNMETYDNECKTVYLPVAAFVTSYARDLLLRSINLVLDDFLYCDTDSIHLLKKTDKLPCDNKKLGYFKFEYSGKARYIKQKTYIVQYDKEFIKKDDNGNDIEYKICCAGLNQNYIKNKNIKIGLDDFVEHAKFPKLCSVNIEGGVALIEREHEITPPNYTEHTENYSCI